MKTNKQIISSMGKMPFARITLRKTRWMILPALLLTLLFSNCRKENFKTDNAENGLAKNGTKRIAAIPTKGEALLAMDVYTNAFYQYYGTYGPSYKGFYWADQGKTIRCPFWNQAETIETLIDAYNVSSTPAYKDLVQYLYNGMRDQSGTLWTANTYNDDVIWGALMCIRAYEITNDGGQLIMAKDNFDLVWNRGWDTGTLGGGIWWTTANNTKNTCVNAPAAICAMRIFKATGDTTYRHKAKLIMDWMVSKLYVASTGEVKGAILPSGYISEGALTYTQGTFIGAANELRPYYPSVNYLAMGKKAMDYAKSSLSVSPGSYLQDEAFNGDASGGKSIFARWACIFVQETGTVADYGTWLDLNATQAWGNRNSNGLMWNVWGTRAPDSPTDLNVNAWTASCGVSMMLNLYRFR